MKKSLLTILMISTLLSFSACGTDQRAAEEAELDAVSASINGTLLKFTGSQLSLETEDGQQLSFDNCSSAELKLENGIVPGNDIILVYTGSIKDTDTSNARLRKIITTDDNSSLFSMVKKEEPEDENADASDTDAEETSAKKENKKTSTNEGSLVDASSLIGRDLPETDVELEEVTETATIARSVNVRSDAQKGSQILGVFDRGSSVTLTGICENGWYRVIFEGQTGYVWKDFVSRASE